MTTPDETLGRYEFQNPRYAGAYHLGGDGPTISFAVARKPSAWHRFWMRTCLGWVWRDA